MRANFIFLFLLLKTALFAQDTLRLSLTQADSIFLENNLILLAQTYQIKASEALVLQAKIYNNPHLTTEWSFLNNNRTFDIGRAGQKAVEIEQVIQLAGKRNKQILLAKQNARYTQQQFMELLRTLKLELRSSFQTIYFNNITINKYNEQLNLLNTIIEALQLQNSKGNIPLKEVLRLKALYYQLNNDRTDLYAELLNAQNKLQILLNINAYVKPIFRESELTKYQLNKVNLNNALTYAIENRSDLKLSEISEQQALTNLQIQKKQAIPDIGIGAKYDQAGSYLPNYTALTFSTDIPVFNRNQGNIAAAKALVRTAQANLEQNKKQVATEVINAYVKLQQVDAEYTKVDSSFSTTFEDLNQGYIINFQKRNISMIEFVDFFEAYNQSILQINKLNEKRIRTYEEFNYVVGQELF